VIVPICFIAMYITITGEDRATPAQSMASGITPVESCPVRKVTL
jgi:hypothetical protein